MTLIIRNFLFLFAGITLFILTGCKKETPENLPVGITIGAWTDLQKGISVDGWGYAYCISNGNKGYAILDEGVFFEIDFENGFNRKRTNFPVHGSTGATFTLVHLNDSVLVFSNMSKTIYQYRDGSWSNHSIMPSFMNQFWGYYHGISASDNLYLVSSARSYRYSETAKAWEIIESMPSTQSGSIAGTNLNGKAYIVRSKGEVFEFDPETENWTYITDYPGRILNRLVSFSQGNKIYFGLSHIDHSPSYKEYWFDNKLWSFDIHTKTWKEEEKYPFELSYGRFLSFFINGKLYVGHEPLKGYYQLYSYDPAQNE
jgi:hypothetical protein